MAESRTRLPFRTAWCGVWLALAFASGGTKARAEDAASGKRSLLFDMGTESSPLERAHTRVTETTVFSLEQGFGWEKAAEGSFDRPEATPPDDLRRDGVYSKEDMTFRVSVKPGRYYVRVFVGDPAQTREKMSVYLQDQELASDVSTKVTWWRGEATSLLVTGTVQLAEEVLQFRFFHEGTGNSVQAIQVIPDAGGGLDPAAERAKLPASLDARVFGAALDACRTRDLKKGIEEVGKIFETGTDFPKAWILTWIAGQVDYPGDEIELIKSSISLLESALLRNPKDFAAQKRLLQNRDYLTAITYFRMEGYSDLPAKTGTGWGERRRIAQNLLSQFTQEDPLHFCALLNLGRIFYWVGQKADDQVELAKANACFKSVLKAFPGNLLARMYLGDRLPWGESYRETVANAPKWATKQREALARLNDIISYWIDHRQSATGEFGGGWGDDVEMMRWWHAAAFATGSDKIAAAMQRLADGVWTQSGIIADGFFRGVAEVQSASEPTSDTQPAMLALRFGDPEYVERCLATARLAGTLWTAINPKGHRLFKSVDIGSQRVGTDEGRGLDVPYHARALLPAHWVAWHTRHPELTRLFGQWADSWVEASQRTDKGKPKGIPPAAIAFLTEELGGLGTPWYNPNLGPSYYIFPGGLDLLFEHLLATFQLTRDEKVLLPIESCLGLLQNPPGEAEKGGAVGGQGWVAPLLESSYLLAPVWSKWRILTGKTQYDEFLKRSGSPYIKWYLTGNKESLVEGCDKAISSMDSNFELLTSEVRYTDRVQVTNTAHLLAMATGGPGVPGAFPSWRATWHTNTKNFAALMLPEEGQPSAGGEKALRALIFNFETNPIKVRMRLWALEPGEYELLLGPDADGDDKMDQAETQSKFAVHGRGTPIDFQLPPGNLYQLTVKLVTEFQGTQAARADIAVSPDDILVFPSRPAEGERALVLARIRNIGPEPAPKVLAAFSMGSRPDVTDQSKTVTVALDTPQGLWTTASWAWAELEAKGPKASFSVRAEIPDAKPASELTLENNQASRQITTGTETHAAFATIFLQGQLSQRLVPVWLDLAQVYESGAKASLPPERVGSLQKSLQDAAANAGEEELRLIRNLKTYLQELTSPEHRGTAATEPSKPSEMRAFFFDMGTPSSPLEREHIRVTEKTVFTPERGYGWEKPAEGSFDRPDSTPPSDLKRDGVFDSNDLTFRVAVKPGRYYIRVTVGDPGEPGKGQRLLREKMSIYIQNHPLSTNLTTDSNWWRGDATSLLVSGSVQLGEEIMEFRFFHEGTANSVQAIQILPDTGLEFNPGVERDKLPPSLDWAVFGPAIEAYQRKNYVRAVEALEKVFEPNTDFTKAWLLTWVAGAVDYPGDELGVIKKSLSLLESAVLRDPNHFAARKRLLQNQDYLTAVTCLRQAGYSDSVAKTGTGWGERRRIAENLLSQVPPQDPLFYQALLNQGRIFYWVGQKSGSSHEFTKASACFLKVQEVFPGSALVRMYLGERLPWGNTYREPVDNAPAWAQRQREALARINDIIGFWMDRRQEASGEFGGGWGDDVEMMRWWAPAAFVTGSDKVTESMTRLADGLWTKSGIIADGFFRGVAEVQYAAEPTSDTLPAMMALKFGDPVYVERCLATGYLMDSLWTNFNPKGHRLFKSVDLGSRGIGQDTKRALDVPYHARAVLPAHWAAWYARSPRFLYLFREWADSWVAASQRKDKNKPPGVPPAAIAFATEELGGYEATWFNPKLGPIYYNFPGGVEILFEHLLATYQLTREDKYLIPIESCLALLRSSLDSQETKGMVGGSQWVARVLQSSDSLGDVWSKWRLLSGKRVFDDYLKRYGSPYVKWYLTGDKRFLVEGCQTVIGSIDHNFELLTSEVRYTDRVKVSGVPHLLAMGTGGPGLPNAFPCWKVTWQTHTKNFAALVLQEEKQPLPGDQTSVRALAYNFESDPLNVQVWLWSLMPGRYEMAIGPDTDGDDRMDFMAERSEFSVYERSTPISFVLPPDALYEVAIRQLHVFRAIREQRPDLAVSLGDMHIFPSRPLKGERVFVMARVHNIGGTEAPNVRVSLLSGEDAETTELATRRWVSLDAPKDLQPRTAWIWADVPMHAEEAHFRVRAEMAGANPGDELTLRNNQAVRDVRAGDKPNTRFEEIFSRGKLNERMVPPWVELAQVLEGETILSDVSIQRLGESLSAAAVGAGEDEMRMIGNLAGYLKELAERREVSESGGTDGRGVNQPPSRQLEPGQGPESGPPKQ